MLSPPTGKTSQSRSQTYGPNPSARMPGPEPGTYVLLLRIDSPADVEVGRLGEAHFMSGPYAYTGSALGSGGLSARVGRHLRSDTLRRPHWHIDALTARWPIKEVWWGNGKSRQECVWAWVLGAGGRREPSGFGASDCRCPGHLVWLGDLGGVASAWRRMRDVVGPDLSRWAIPLSHQPRQLEAR